MSLAGKVLAGNGHSMVTMNVSHDTSLYDSSKLALHDVIDVDPAASVTDWHKVPALGDH